MRVFTSAFLLLAACWTSEVKPVPAPRTTPPTEGERRAIVRIGPEPGGTTFQGVWLELAGDKKWVVDYQPRALWKPFQDREVLVSGYCYQPEGQAVTAPHFHVDRMLFVKPEMGRGPILEIGPEQVLRGAFSERGFAPGSKLAGSTETRFESYGIQGASVDLPEAGKRVLVIAREIQPDMSWTAQTGGPKLWILDVRAEDAVVEERAKIDCPQ
jgi:hypothetical protein